MPKTSIFRMVAWACTLGLAFYALFQYQQTTTAEKLASREQRAIAYREVRAAPLEHAQRWESLDPLYKRTLEIYLSERADDAGMDYNHLLTVEPSASSRLVKIEAALTSLSQKEQQDAQKLATLIEQCRPIFGDDCHSIMGTWRCIEFGECTEEAQEAIELTILESEQFSDFLYDSCTNL